MSTTDIWKKSLEIIKGQIPSQHFTTWFKPIQVAAINETSLELEVPNRFFLEWQRDHYLPLIQETIKKVSLREYSIVWRIGKMAVQRASATISPSAAQTVAVERVLTNTTLNPYYTFENFVVGKDNQLAHAACLAVANQFSNKYNPLFVYGGVGLGKTHLLQAVGHRVLQRINSTKICYYTSEGFMNEFIGAMQRGKMDDFRNKFRRTDLLLIDDVQFWAGGKGRTQEEFFHTFNALYEANKQIVITSDKYPKDLDGLEERLRSRFEMGLIVDIQPPDMETKVAILQKKAALDSIVLPDDVTHFLASLGSSNIRELEGYLAKIIAVSSLSGKEITLPMVKEALKNIIKDHTAKSLTVDKVQKAVASFFNINTADIKSKRRLQNIVVPRQMAMYLAREYCKASFPEIGAAFGNKDHSTVIHAVNKVRRLVEKDTEQRKIIASIKNLLDKSR
ncbi:MAG: chromosomal replication initiator protein DnaA [Deltaproteobacteria bacterium]|nr:chromosomal replication initiator protein DnaA [Deltaproteobacteria bacterium]